MKNNYNCISTFRVIKITLLVLLFYVSNNLYAQVGTQSPSIRTGVTFQWSDEQDINNDGDIDPNENNRAATIQSITINGVVFDAFAVPTGYQLTRLGGGNGSVTARHNRNGIVLNDQNPLPPYTTGPFTGEIIGTSETATFDPTDTTSDWDNAALTAFKSKNLNFYFTSNGNGDDICGNFDKANGTNGQTETHAQIQTLFYNPSIPSNEGGILAVTERGGNNCYYIRVFGTRLGETTETVLGDTFVRTSGDLRDGDGPTPPADGSDYWESDREVNNTQSIAIALFELDNLAPKGSKISRIQFVAASRDDGDGKLFILQRYAQPQVGLACIDGIYNGQIDNSTSVPDGSTYSLVANTLQTTPSNLGTGTLNFSEPDGSYTYMPPPGFVGTVTFDYEVCLPPSFGNVCDTNTVTLTFNDNPENPVLDVSCNADGTYNLEIVGPIGDFFEYNVDIVNGGAYQSSPIFNNLGPGTYVFGIRNIATGCENTPSITQITLATLEAEVNSTTDIDCFGNTNGAIDLNVIGGFPPYTYSWTKDGNPIPETTQDLNNISSGIYNVTIQDSAGCSFTFANGMEIIINSPTAELSKTVSSFTNIKCFGESTGAIDIEVEGGTAPYSFSWSNGENTEDISGLSAGTYLLTVTDANGCILNESFTINQPTAALAASISASQDVNCFGEATGSATVSATGGTAGYTYSWNTSPVQTTATAT
ncbi:hypothetical protein ACFQ1Q_00095, partial [Winogradskyella litorisediminis]